VGIDGRISSRDRRTDIQQNFGVSDAHENIGRVITELLNKTDAIRKLPTIRRTSQLHLIHEGKTMDDLSRIYTGVLAKMLNDWIERSRIISDFRWVLEWVEERWIIFL
jgi:hypothetical protein